MILWKATWRAALVLALLLLGTAGPARAGIVYDITADTSGLVNTTGSIELLFTPTGGTGTLEASVQVLPGNDALFGSVTSPPLGAVTAPGGGPPLGLPLTFTADNTNGPQTNDATLGLTYGNTLALEVSITPSDALSTASFFLTLFDQSGNFVFPISNDPSNPFGSNPAAVELDLAPNPGGTAPTVNPPLLNPDVSAQPPAGAVPEPASVVLLGTALTCLAGYGLRRRRCRRVSG